ncbi:MAG: hypothetical protein JEY91_03970 [Spirochaetaceae bacterium]|nr:hypothetical protein [Spirochaetaceae bacterium]
MTYILKDLFKSIETFLSSDKQERITEALDPEDLKRILNLDESRKREDPGTIGYWIDKYLHYCVKTHHFGFSNRMWSGANIPSIAGEIASAVSQTSAGSYEAAPVSVLMEKYMIDQMIRLAEFTDGEGQMTTGSSNANMIAMMTARNIVSDHMKSTGLSGHRQLFAFVSENAHYSLDKTVNILGIGLDHLIKIPVDKKGKMNVEILEQEINLVKERGGDPFFVTATLGTTVRGAFDPLPAIIKLRDKYKFWLHADGAWGGAAIFSDSLKNKYLTGLESVDSFTLDFHKMPGTSLICNVLLFNNRPGIMDFTCNVGDKSYLHRKEDNGGDYNLGTYSLQCGRRVDSLKWFLDWKYYQKSGFGDRIEKYHKLAELGEGIITESEELEMVVPRESFNLCFRYKIDGNTNRFNQILRTELYKSGKMLLAYGYIGKALTLRLLFTHQNMNEKNLRYLLESVIETGNYLKENWRNYEQHR